MAKFKLHHIAISVEDFDETLIWYNKMFNSELISSYKHEQLRADIGFIRIGDMQIEIICMKDFSENPSETKILKKDLEFIGLKHIAIQVENLAETYEELNEKGVSFIKKPSLTISGYRHAFLLDNSNIFIELVEH